MVNCHVPFPVIKKLTLEAGLAPPSQTQAYLSQRVFQVSSLTQEWEGRNQPNNPRVKPLCPWGQLDSTPLPTVVTIIYSMS